MKVDEIKKIEELYLLKSNSFNSHKYEIKLIEGLKKDVEWLSLSDKEKLELRKIEMRKKHALKEIYSDLIILYEESVIELVELVMKFLNEINVVAFNSENMSEEEFLLFRLKNMLYIELFAVNKRPKLQYSGHVLFEEVVEPIFSELENTTFYVQYKLQDLKDTYKNVSDLYKKDPYKKY
ncbi:hypothetical protein [Flavobacterium piscisymbiosum]|uniref:Uncharacterized protein n=1 Tax=Flavobacterium piscisymbiosum TaxID=2893753 RepID=A0ABS8MF91_9FLAO|nr:hypothetical protein [Flavobacterium sp. F-30]MCC9064161.1 hypothetical protein [Flavobacterium sp. F-30]